MTEVTCLGILVADVIAHPVERVPEPRRLELVDRIDLRGGGCALNTSTALVRLGVPAACAGKVRCTARSESALTPAAARCPCR